MIRSLLIAWIIAAIQCVLVLPLESHPSEDRSSSSLTIIGPPPPPPPPGPPTLTDTNVGDIAVVHADATILQPGKPFDLNRRTITFTTRSGGGYDITAGELEFDTNLGADLRLTDNSHGQPSSQQNLPFTFSFYNQPYSTAFVNGDGHITFGHDDPEGFHFNPFGCDSSCDRLNDIGDPFSVLDVFAGDLPRIAALWQDWVPDPSSPAARVFARIAADRLVVTWQSVPIFDTNAKGGAGGPDQSGRTATFQAILFSDGRIKFNYADVAYTPGGGYLVGISPGSSGGVLTTTVDFSQGGGSVSACTVDDRSPCYSIEPLAQVFGCSTTFPSGCVGSPVLHDPLLQVSAVSRRLHMTHADRFDQGVFFTSFSQSMGRAFSFEIAFKQSVSGIGADRTYDLSSFSGSGGRGHSIVNMGPLFQFPFDPSTIFLGTNNTLNVMGQEVGHMWLARLRYDNTCTTDLLGRDHVHWSFFFNSDGSVMEGNKWQDNGDFTFTSSSTEETIRYSTLDQYAMGLRAPSEGLGAYNPFVIQNPGDTGGRTAVSPPEFGVTVSGSPQYISLDRVQTCEGPRIPASGFSGVNPTTVWNQAFVLVVPSGASASSSDLSKLESIRSAWVPFFNQATSGRGTVSTSLASGSPVLGLTATALDFGSVTVGSSGDLSFIVANRGGDALTGSITTSAPFSIVAGGSWSLGAGASQTVTARFSPVSLGSVAGTINVTSNAGNPTIPVSGTGTSRPAFTLTVLRSGSGHGTVSGSPGIDCGTTCTRSYESGTVVILTAVSAADSTFAGWTGCDTVVGAQCTVTVTSNRSLTAVFVIKTFTLRLVTVGQGRVTSDPSGIDCGSDCSEVLVFGTQVVLTATAAVDWKVSAWIGCDVAVDTQCTLTMTSDRSVTVAFADLKASLFISLDSTGRGTVTSDPLGIQCLAVCEARFLVGSPVVLTASPDSTATFDGWSGCDSVSGLQCTITMTTQRTVHALFTPKNFGLLLTISGAGHGTVRIDPGGVTCSSSCTTFFPRGSVLTVTPTAASGSMTDTLFGCDSGFAGPCTVTMGRDRDVEVPFALAPAGSDIRQLLVTANDLVYDPFRKRIYASVTAGGSSDVDRVIPIDPTTGAIGEPIAVGRAPKKLLFTDDGRSLYVGIDGAMQRINLSTGMADLQFSLASEQSFGLPASVEDMKQVPGQPHSIAVSRMLPNSSPRHTGVGIYDDGVVRPVTTSRDDRANSITFGASPTRLYGLDNEITTFGFRRMTVGPTGVSVDDVLTSFDPGYLGTQFGEQITFVDGLLYTNAGRIVDPEARRLVGTFVFPANVFPSAFVPDAAVRRMFFITLDPGPPWRFQLRAVDPTTRAVVGSIDLPGIYGGPTSLARWGDDGLAFRTSGGQIFFVRTNLVPAPVVRPVLLTKNGSGMGTVTSLPVSVNCGPACVGATVNFATGSSVTLTATSEPNSTFAGWSGVNDCGTSTTCTVTMNAAQNITATFTAKTVTLAVSMSGNGTGSITSDVGGITCGVTCSAALNIGSTVTLHANPDTNSTFVGWSGGGCSGTAPCVVTLTEAQTVSATFALKTFALTVNKSGNGAGTVTGDVGGVTCGTTCVTTLNAGMTVTLTATPDANSIFSGWSGSDCSGTGTCVVNVNAARTVSATFALKTFTLTVNKSGNGTGSITSNVGSINCGTTCASAPATFDSGTSVTLTATPDANSSFTGWSGGDCSGVGTCVVNVNAAQTVIATFTMKTFNVTVSKSGNGAGAVTSDAGGINCGTACATTVNSGTTVTLTAAPDTNSIFTGWSGADCPGTSTCVVSVNAVQTVTATFTLKTFTLTVNKSGSGAGSVTSNAGGIVCGTSCVTTVNVGTTVTLTAAPDANSTFTGWSGADCSGTGPCTVSVTAAQTVTATFTLKTFTLTVNKTGNGIGGVTSDVGGIVCGTTCSGTPTTLNVGTVVTLTATPDTNSTFTGWNGGGCSGTTPCVVTVSSAQAVTATFTLKTFALTVNVSGTGTGTVASNVGAINCPGACTTTVNINTLVTLTASPANGSAFVGWIGVTGCGASTTCAVTVDAAKTATATFSPTFALGITLTGGGGGTISGAGASCTSNCSTAIVSGALVTLTATPATGGTFAGWSGACGGTGTCAVTMTQARNVTATFTFPLTIIRSGVGGGTVTSNPAAINCGDVCVASVPFGTSLVMTAVPATTDSKIAAWSACAGQGACGVNVNGPLSVTVTFTGPLPDLIVPSVTMTTASVAPGGHVAAAATVLNQGRSAAGASTMRFYLAHDTTLHASDHLLLTTLAVPSLGAGQQTSSPIAGSLIVPTTIPGGQYFLIACADGLLRVTESNETNNCAAAPTTVTVLGVDLVVDEVTLQAASVKRGRSVAVVTTVRNQGAVVATVSMTRFYLSADATRDGSDRLLTGLRTVGALKPGAQSRGSITVTVPATTPAGTYFVLACADDLNRVSESVESNNCRASATTIDITQ